MLAFITALSGPDLTDREAAVLRATQPCGVILFTRNAHDPRQVARLVADAQQAIGTDVPILIDQEGGRVQRLGPPHWRKLPPAAAYAQSFAADPQAACAAARAVARLTAAELRGLGITCNCAPVLDLPVAGSHQIIGDRAYGVAPQVAQVVQLGRAVAEGLMAGGVLPVIKHIPGHGRATKDSHLDLPVVTASRAELEATDFAPFRALADLPAAMTAHVVFTALDAERPASISPDATAQVIRSGIGFDGLLMSDDLGMKALLGSIPERARAVLAAGSDVALLCSGELAETEALAAAVPPLQGPALARYRRACAVIGQQQPFDAAEAQACLAGLLRAGA